MGYQESGSPRFLWTICNTPALPPLSTDHATFSLNQKAIKLIEYSIEWFELTPILNAPIRPLWCGLLLCLPMAASVPVIIGASGSTSSVTSSGVSSATITIRDLTQQQALSGQNAEQAIAGLNRDVSSDQDSSNALAPIFNQQEIETGFEIVGALAREAGTFLNNRAKQADRTQLEAKQTEARALDNNNGLSDPQRLALLEHANTLRTEAQRINQQWGAGGVQRQIVTALLAGISGNVSAASQQFAQNMVASGNFLQIIQEPWHFSQILVLAVT